MDLVSSSTNSGTPSVLVRICLSIGTQKGPPIGVQKGPLSLRFV
jgi:hypothetical protein